VSDPAHAQKLLYQSRLLASQRPRYSQEELNKKKLYRSLVRKYVFLTEIVGNRKECARQCSHIHRFHKFSESAGKRPDLTTANYIKQKKKDIGQSVVRLGREKGKPRTVSPP
jgi:hypothetical protein